MDKEQQMKVLLCLFALFAVNFALKANAIAFELPESADIHFYLSDLQLFPSLR